MEVWLSGFLVVTNDYDDARSQASKYEQDIVGCYTGPYYYIHHHRYMGFSYAVDGFLSHPAFNTNANQVRINRAKINGSNLEIEFYNSSGASALVYVEGRAKVYRKRPI